MVAPLLGAYIGGIVYLGLIHPSIPQGPQRLENFTARDQEITASSKNAASANISGSVPLEHF